MDAVRHAAVGELGMEQAGIDENFEVARDRGLGQSGGVDKPGIHASRCFKQLPHNGQTCRMGERLQLASEGILLCRKQIGSCHSHAPKVGKKHIALSQ